MNIQANVFNQNSEVNQSQTITINLIYDLPIEFVVGMLAFNIVRFLQNTPFLNTFLFQTPHISSYIGIPPAKIKWTKFCISKLVPWQVVTVDS